MKGRLIAVSSVGLLLVLLFLSSVLAHPASSDPTPWVDSHQVPRNAGAEPALVPGWASDGPSSDPVPTPTGVPDRPALESHSLPGEGASSSTGPLSLTGSYYEWGWAKTCGAVDTSTHPFVCVDERDTFSSEDDTAHFLAVLYNVTDGGSARMVVHRPDGTEFGQCQFPISDPQDSGYDYWSNYSLHCSLTIAGTDAINHPGTWYVDVEIYDYSQWVHEETLWWTLVRDCPGSGEMVFVTQTDNENNSFTGQPDHDMGSTIDSTDCIYNERYKPNCPDDQDYRAPIEFNILADSLPASLISAQLSLSAWDVDEEGDAANPGRPVEEDEVYFNGHYVGTLTGADQVYSTSVFDIDPAWVQQGKNLVEVLVDTEDGCWCVNIQWGQLILNGGGGAAWIREAYNDRDCYAPGQSVNIYVEVDTALASQEVLVETSLIDPNNVTVASKTRTFTTYASADDAFVESLTLPLSAMSGTYTKRVIVYDTCSESQNDIWTHTFEVDPTCGTVTPVVTDTPTPTAEPCTCPTTNLTRDPGLEAGLAEWNTWSSAGHTIIRSPAAEGSLSAHFEGEQGTTVRDELWQVLTIPPNLASGTFVIEHLAAGAAFQDPPSGNDRFIVSFYDATGTVELVRLLEFDPTDPPYPQSLVALSPTQLAAIAGRTVQLRFTLQQDSSWLNQVFVTIDCICLTLQTAPPTPTPDPCTVEGDKQASPDQVQAGDETTVVITLHGLDDCPEVAQSADVMLIIDRSGSMQGALLQDAKNAAKTFVDMLDLSPDRDRVGVVSFETGAQLEHALSRNGGSVKVAIDGLSTMGYTNIGDGISQANQELTLNGRPGAAWITILLTDGVPNRPHSSSSGFSETDAAYARSFAQAGRNAGITLYTIGLGSGVSHYFLDDGDGSTHTYNPGDPAGHPYAQPGLAFVGGGRYYYAPTSSELEAVYQGIAGVIRAEPWTNGTLVDVLSDDVTYVPGSAWPPLDAISADQKTLTWNIPLIRRNETKTFTYRVRLSQTAQGYVCLNDSTQGSYTDSNGQPATVDIPPACVTVKSALHDVYCKDHDTDDGDVPSNRNGEDWWISPDIWVREQQDGVPQHQNPQGGQTNYVYVRVRNRGNATLTNVNVGVYWAVGAASIRWPDQWTYIGQATVSSIGPGQVRTVSVPWRPSASGHYCFLARIHASLDPVKHEGMVPFDNNLCQRNIHVLPPEQSWHDNDVTVGNPFGSPVQTDVDLDSDQYPADGGITVSMDPSTFTKWQDSGGTVQGGQVIPGTSAISIDVSPPSGGTVPEWQAIPGLTSTSVAASSQDAGIVHARILGIPLSADETTVMGLQLDAPGDGKPELMVKQMIDGQAVGGSVYRPPDPLSGVYLPLVLRH